MSIIAHYKCDMLPIACALLVWVFLTHRAKKVSQTVYQLKASLLADYLSQELKQASVKLKFT